MARTSHTPIPFWEDMPLQRLFAWIRSANEITAEEDEDAKRKNGKK